MTRNDFPRLTPENHRVTSPRSPDYNCVAWAAGDTTHWWQPGTYWPVAAPSGDYGVGVLEQAFVSLGFTACENDSVEEGFEKIAIYGWSLFYTHAARQLASGRWTSKLGREEDIEHQTPYDLEGGLYGAVVQFMKRRIELGVAAESEPSDSLV